MLRAFCYGVLAVTAVGCKRPASDETVEGYDGASSVLAVSYDGTHVWVVGASANAEARYAIRFDGQTAARCHAEVAHKDAKLVATVWTSERSVVALIRKDDGVQDRVRELGSSSEDLRPILDERSVKSLPRPPQGMRYALFEDILAFDPERETWSEIGKLPADEDDRLAATLDGAGNSYRIVSQPHGSGSHGALRPRLVSIGSTTFDGSLRWMHQIDGESPVAAVGRDGRTAVVLANRLVAYEPNGKTVTDEPADFGERSPSTNDRVAVHPSGVIVLAAGRVLYLRTGRQTWVRSKPSFDIDGLVATEDGFFAAGREPRTERLVVGGFGLDGRERWTGKPSICKP